MSRIINGIEVEEYDGYKISEPIEMTNEERAQLEKKIHELRKKVRQSNGLPEKQDSPIKW